MRNWLSGALGLLSPHCHVLLPKTRNEGDSVCLPFSRGHARILWRKWEIVIAYDNLMDVGEVEHVALRCPLRGQGLPLH